MDLRDIVVSVFTIIVIFIIMPIFGYVIDASNSKPDPFVEYQNRFEGLDSWCPPRSSRWILKDTSTNTCIIGCDTQTKSKELGPFPCVK